MWLSALHERHHQKAHFAKQMLQLFFVNLPCSSSSHKSPITCTHLSQGRQASWPAPQSPPGPDSHRFRFFHTEVIGCNPLDAGIDDILGAPATVE